MSHILDYCFKQEKGKRPELRKVTPSRNTVRAHLEKANGNLRAAKLMFENRVKVQYGTQVLTNNDAEWIIEDAEDFVLKIEELLME